MMASFASVHVSTANKTLVLWSVVSLDPSQNFGEVFQSLQAGKYTIIKTSTELTAAILDSNSVSVGNAPINVMPHYSAPLRSSWGN